MHRENWSEGHLSNFRRALQLILSSALKLTIAMLQLYREECRKPDVGRVALGRGKRGQSAGAAHLSYPDPEAHPSSASAPTLYHIPSSHLISNMWRKVQQKYRRLPSYFPPDAHPSSSASPDCTSFNPLTTSVALLLSTMSSFLSNVLIKYERIPILVANN